MVWSSRGITKRITVISMPGRRSPFRISCMTFFRAAVLTGMSPFSEVVQLVSINLLFFGGERTKETTQGKNHNKDLQSNAPIERKLIKRS